MKDKKTLKIIGAAGLIVQFVAVALSFITGKKEERKPSILLFIISAIASGFGAFVLYKEVIAPKVTKLIDDITNIGKIEDDEDDVLSFDDFWAKDESEEAE